MQRTRQRILECLRERGSATIVELRHQVGLAEVTLRHHLGVLARQGLIWRQAPPRGRGRPRHVFALTPAGAGALHGDRYLVLAQRLLEAMNAVSPGSAEAAVRQMARDVASAAAVGEVASAEERLNAAMRLLEQEGFTAQWSPTDGGYRMIVANCPYRDLAMTNKELCVFDADMLKIVTGLEVTPEKSCGENGSCCFRLHRSQ